MSAFLSTLSLDCLCSGCAKVIVDGALDFMPLLFQDTGKAVSGPVAVTVGSCFMTVFSLALLLFFFTCKIHLIFRVHLSFFPHTELKK